MATASANLTQVQMTAKSAGGFRCEICSGGEVSGRYEAREMMFGLRTAFHYAQCAGCGALWLTDPPEDFGPYYPDHYYSLTERNGLGACVRNYLRAERDKTYFGKGGVVGRFVARVYEEGALISVSKLEIRRDARILDVGCGSGKLLRRMAAFGFQNLTGIDPFLSQEVHERGRLQIRKCRLEDLTGEQYDLVMFHHSLEHVANPAGTLRSAAGLLARGGKCLVRLPVVAYAWEKYGANWVQLDPPRHMWIPTENSMRVLAKSVGFRLEAAQYDSTGFQFWGSELYVRGVELRRANLWRLAREFGLSGLKGFAEQATVLNRGRMGDQGIFLLEWAG